MEAFDQQIHHRGYLPHVDGADYQFITYHLIDSLPKAALESLQAFRGNTKTFRIEQWLNQGHGECVLNNPRSAQTVIDNWKHHDNKLYELLAYTVMPNHVHVLIKVFPGQKLSRIIHAWKSYTSKKIQAIIGAGEPPALPVQAKEHARIWQADYFDRYIRDERHLNQTVQYIYENPVKAGLVKRIENWPFSGGRLWTAGGPPASSPGMRS